MLGNADGQRTADAHVDVNTADAVEPYVLMHANYTHRPVSK